MHFTELNLLLDEVDRSLSCISVGLFMSKELEDIVPKDVPPEDEWKPITGMAVSTRNSDRKWTPCKKNRFVHLYTREILLYRFQFWSSSSIKIVREVKVGVRYWIEKYAKWRTFWANFRKLKLNWDEMCWPNWISKRLLFCVYGFWRKQSNSGLSSPSLTIGTGKHGNGQIH